MPLERKEEREVDADIGAEKEEAGGATIMLDANSVDDDANGYQGGGSGDGRPWPPYGHPLLSRFVHSCLAIVRHTG